MTKERLRKLKALLKEAEHLQELLLQPPSVKQYVIDYAKDYRSGYPIPFTIAGYGQENYTELRQKLYEKLRLIQVEITGLEAWLDEIDDPQLRDILRLQYINGMTHEQIADELGYVRETVSRKLKMFWESYK